MSELLDNLPALQAKDLSKRYTPDGPLVVDGVSLEVNAGEIYGLLGPNGSGKSTTVAMLVTLAEPTGGTALVMGHDVVAEPLAARQRLGVALQDAGVDPAATGRELLELHARLFGLRGPEPRQRAAELLRDVDLEGAADRRVRTYSGGMRRRLDLAAALIGRPDVVVLDEPTTGLDPASREALWARVRDLRNRGAAILLTTQYLEEADRLADRVGILADGRLRVEDRPDALKAEYRAETLDDVFFEVTGLERPGRSDDVTVVAA